MSRGVSVRREAEFHSMSNIIIGVPGMWKDRSDIVISIAKGEHFLFAGHILMEVATHRGCEIEIYDFDPQLEAAFRTAAQGRMTEGELKAIGQHHHTLYLLSKSASVEIARDMMGFAKGLLECGGLGVKIESSGVAHSAARWAAFAPSDSFDLLCAFVTLVGGDPFYSCGMHNFALPDCQMAPVLNPIDAATIMNGFNSYRLEEAPVLEEGHTFSLEQDGLMFQLSKRQDEKFVENNPFHNPNGVWNLELL